MGDEKRYCLNCSAELHGEFCSSCGQRDRDIHIPVRELATELIEVLPTFDRRLIRSISSLLFSPGFLTQEYLSGKRKQYISPFKLYFVVSFVFFLVSSLTDDSNERRIAKNAITKDSLIQTVNKDTVFVSVGATNSGVRFTVKDSAEFGSIFGPKLIGALKKLQADPSLMFDKIKEHRSKFIFILMPVFAFLLKLLYVRSRTLYIKHLVFSFYFHSFIFVILFLIDIIKIIDFPVVGYLSIPLYLAVPFNLYYGMKRSYGQSAGKTAVKFFLLSSSYAMTFFISISLAAFAIIYLFYT